MVFSSLTFLLIFLPLLLALYFIGRGQKWRNAVLLIFSLIFYAWGEPKWILCMIGATAVNYLTAFGIVGAKSRAVKRAFLAIGAAATLGALFWFKYAAFFLSTAYSILGAQRAVPAVQLPIGISFYTFQILTYSVDVYREKAPVQKNPARLLLYVSCFPQLIAGPIVQYADIAEQLDARTTTVTDFSEGIGRFSVGLGKKVLIANLCGKAVEALLSGNTSLSVAGAWLSALLYTFQIYFDFSAYSDMAIGLGRVLGFTYRENFRYPYVSASVSEFWRRWHISLGSFFRDYVYIPLGGNRKGNVRTVRNLLIVWLLTGFWHGASWNFAVWGLYYAFWILTERFVLNRILDRIPKVLRVAGTFLIAAIGWVLFYHTSLGDGWRHILAMFGVGAAGLWDANVQEVLSSVTALPLIAAVCCLPIVPAVRAWAEKRPKRASALKIAVPILETGVLLLSLAFLIGQSYNPFIYFRF